MPPKMTLLTTEIVDNLSANGSELLRNMCPTVINNILKFTLKCTNGAKFIIGYTDQIFSISKREDVNDKEFCINKTQILNAAKNDTEAFSEANLYKYEKNENIIYLAVPQEIGHRICNGTYNIIDSVIKAVTTSEPGLISEDTTEISSESSNPNLIYGIAALGIVSVGILLAGGAGIYKLCNTSKKSPNSADAQGERENIPLNEVSVKKENTFNSPISDSDFSLIVTPQDSQAEQFNNPNRMLFSTFRGPEENTAQKTSYQGEQFDASRAVIGSSDEWSD